MMEFVIVVGSIVICAMYMVRASDVRTADDET